MPRTDSAACKQPNTEIHVKSHKGRQASSKRKIPPFRRSVDDVEVDRSDIAGKFNNSFNLIKKWSKYRPQQPVPQRRRPAIKAAGQGDTDTLLEILSCAPQLLYHVNSRGETAAHAAARAGAVNSIELLLKAAPSLFHVPDRQGRIPANVISGKRNRLVILTLQFFFSPASMTSIVKHIEPATIEQIALFTDLDAFPTAHFPAHLSKGPNYDRTLTSKRCPCTSSANEPISCVSR